MNREALRVKWKRRAQQRAEAAEGAVYFIAALRECLGLDPILDVPLNRSGRKKHAPTGTVESITPIGNSAYVRRWF